MVNKIFDEFLENDFFITLRDITEDMIVAKNNKFYWFVYMESETEEVKLKDIKHIELIRKALITGNDNIYILIVFRDDIRIIEARRILRMMEIDAIENINKNDMRKFAVKIINPNEYSFFI